MKIISLSLIALMTLGGCSIYQEEFDCPLGKGEQCASLGAVNDLANAGKYSRDKTGKSKSPLAKKKTRVYYPGTNQQMTG